MFRFSLLSNAGAITQGLIRLLRLLRNYSITDDGLQRYVSTLSNCTLTSYILTLTLLTTTIT